MGCEDDATTVTSPVRWVGRPASLSAMDGSPALPNMDSTKSRLLTRFRCEKSYFHCFFFENPETSGTTTGRSNSDTQASAFFSPLARNGSVSNESGAQFKAFAKRRAAASLGTAFLSLGIGSPPSVT